MVVIHSAANTGGDFEYVMDVTGIFTDTGRDDLADVPVESRFPVSGGLDLSDLRALEFFVEELREPDPTGVSVTSGFIEVNYEDPVTGARVIELPFSLAVRGDSAGCRLDFPAGAALDTIRVGGTVMSHVRLTVMVVARV